MKRYTIMNALPSSMLAAALHAAGAAVVDKARTEAIARARVLTGLGTGRCTCGQTISRNKPSCFACAQGLKSSGGDQ